MSFWDFSLENTGRTQIVSIQYQEQYGRAKKPVFMRVFAVSSVIRTRLYYFPNDRKYALFGPYLHVQFHKNRAFSHASTKNVFKNVFTELVLVRLLRVMKIKLLLR